VKTVWKTRVLPLAIAGAVIGGLVAGASAFANAGPPPPSGGCRNGYVAASENLTYAGGAGGIGGGHTSVSPVRNEVTGLGCLKVSGRKANLQFSWATSGKLNVGLFWYQLVNCGTNKVVQSKTMQYPNGTAKRNGSASASFSVAKGQKYKIRIKGDGSYQRHSDSLGAVGYFYARPPDAPPGAPKSTQAWTDDSHCVTVK
jgi:hypothetical protein